MGVDSDTSGRQEAVGYRDWPSKTRCRSRVGAGAPFVIQRIEIPALYQKKARQSCRDSRCCAVYSRFSGAGQEICGHGRGGPALASSKE